MDVVAEGYRTGAYPAPNMCRRTTVDRMQPPTTAPNDIPAWYTARLNTILRTQLRAAHYAANVELTLAHASVNQPSR